jgi:hypothetical protein
MPQSYNHLFPQIIAFENLLLAYQNARKSKKQTPAMHAYHFALEDNLSDLHQKRRSRSQRDKMVTGKSSGGPPDLPAGEH